MWDFNTKAEGGTLRWLADYQSVLVNAFVDIESHGFPFDPMAHQNFIDKAESIYAEYEIKLRANQEFKDHCATVDIAPEDFNFGSPPQLSSLLYNTKKEGGLGLKAVSWSKLTKKASTDRASLEHFAKEGSQFCQDLMVIRNFAKLLSSFGEPLLKFFCDDTGAVHPSYFLAKVIDGTGKSSGTRSGRLSCAKPNLQQIPKRDKDGGGTGLSGMDVRRSFVPSPGQLLVEIDQSQVEVRVAGMYAKDKQMGEFFNMGGDFHTRVASMVSGLDYEVMLEAIDDIEHEDHKAMKKLRSSAKQITFGLMFGMGIPKLIKECGLSKEEGEKFIKTYFGIFPQFARWRDATIKEALRTGEARTLFGRVRKLRIGKRETEDKREERIGVNTPIQSAAADITLYGLARIWLELKKRGCKTKIIGTIHDSIIFSVPPGEMNEVLPWVVEYMVTPPGLEWLLEDSPVKLSVGVECGYNFCDMNEVPLDIVKQGRIKIGDYT